MKTAITRLSNFLHFKIGKVNVEASIDQWLQAMSDSCGMCHYSRAVCQCFLQTHIIFIASYCFSLIYH